MSEIRQAKKKSPFSALIPAIGFVMAVCFAVIGWAFSNPLLEWSIDNFRGFTGNELNNIHPDAMQFAFGAFIWLVLICFGSLIVAAAAPRKKSQVKELSLKKDKEEIAKEKKRAKKRQRQIQLQAHRDRMERVKRESGE